MQTLDALIAEAKEKQQIEFALTEQKSKTARTAGRARPTRRSPKAMS